MKKRMLSLILGLSMIISSTTPLMMKAAENTSVSESIIQDKSSLSGENTNKKSEEDKYEIPDEYNYDEFVENNGYEAPTNIERAGLLEVKPTRIKAVRSVAGSSSDVSAISYYKPDYSELPSLRNQGSYGSCWAHATMAMAESSMMKKDSELVADYSEKAIAVFLNSDTNPVDPLGGTVGDINYRADGKWTSGNNTIYSAQALAGWVGATNETLAPYNEMPEITENETIVVDNRCDESIAFDDMAHLVNYYRINKEDRNGIKKAIMEQGAVGAEYYAYSTSDLEGTLMKPFYYNENGENSYYCPSSRFGANHAITIVGWNDNFSKDKFQPANGEPRFKGAWLVRNSWYTGGDEESYNGYFWLSYDDESLSDIMVMEFEQADNYDHNYQYDGAVTTGYVGVKGRLGAANVFTATNEDGEMLKAVSFETNSVQTDYEVNVYRIPEDGRIEDGVLIESATTTGITSYEGYYTIELNSPVLLNKDEKFAVIIWFEKLTGNPWDWDREYLSVYIGYEKETDSDDWFYTETSASEGQSYLVQYNERTDSNIYTDFTKTSYASEGGNLRIKAFTKNVNSFKINYHSNIADNDTVRIINTPCDEATPLRDDLFTREHYNLVGWNTEADGTGENYSADEVVSLGLSEGSEIDLYAVWDKIQFTVTFNNKYGDTKSKIVYSGEPYGEFPTDAPQYHELEGWYDTDKIWKKRIYETDICTGDITLYPMYRHVHTKGKHSKETNSDCVHGGLREYWLCAATSFCSECIDENDNVIDDLETLRKPIDPNYHYRLEPKVASCTIDEFGTSVSTTAWRCTNCGKYYSISTPDDDYAIGFEAEYEAWVNEWKQSVLDGREEPTPTPSDDPTPEPSPAPIEEPTPTPTPEPVEKADDGWGDIDDDDKEILEPSKINESSINVIGVHDEAYTGSAITFDIRVYKGTNLLKEGTDYTVKYLNNKNAGENANVVITGKGAYKTTAFPTQRFKIMPINLDDNAYASNEAVLLKSGKSYAPNPVVMANGKKLKKNKDYVIESSPASFTAVGIYAVKVKGINNYAGELNSTFTVSDATVSTLMSKASVAGLKKSIAYTGSELTIDSLKQPNFKVSAKINKVKTDLVENVDYTISYINNKEVGTASIILRAVEGNANNLVGEKVLTFKIIGTQLAKINLTGTTFDYTGKQIKPSAVVTAKGSYATLTEGKDYTIEYRKNIQLGTATIYAKGINGYTGTIKKTFKIKAIDLRSSKIKTSIVDGNVKVTFNERVLIEGKDYTLSRKTKNGVTTVTVKGKGNFAKSVVISM